MTGSGSSPFIFWDNSSFLQSFKHLSWPTSWHSKQSDHVWSSCWTLCSSAMHTFGIHLCKATTHIDVWRQPLQELIHQCIHLRTCMKVNISRTMLCCCIGWKSPTLFSCCPALTYLASLVFQEMLITFRVPGDITSSLASTHGGFKLLFKQSTSCNVLCLKSGY